MARGYAQAISNWHCAHCERQKYANADAQNPACMVLGMHVPRIARARYGRLHGIEKGREGAAFGEQSDSSWESQQQQARATSWES